MNIFFSRFPETLFRIVEYYSDLYCTTPCKSFVIIGRRWYFIWSNFWNVLRVYLYCSYVPKLKNFTKVLEIFGHYEKKSKIYVSNYLFVRFSQFSSEIRRTMKFSDSLIFAVLIRFTKPLIFSLRPLLFFFPVWIYFNALLLHNFFVLNQLTYLRTIRHRIWFFHVLFSKRKNPAHPNEFISLNYYCRSNAYLKIVCVCVL